MPSKVIVVILVSVYHHNSYTYSYTSVFILLYYVCVVGDLLERNRYIFMIEGTYIIIQSIAQYLGFGLIAPEPNSPLGDILYFKYV